MANLPPSTSDGKASRGGTMLDHLQVTVTSTGEHLKLQKTDVRLKIIVTFRQIQIMHPILLWILGSMEFFFIFKLFGRIRFFFVVMYSEVNLL